MEPQRFEIGQPVTPKANAKWIGDTSVPHPKRGEIYHVLMYRKLSWCSHWVISFYDLGNPNEDGYSENEFDAVVTDKVLEKDLELIKEAQPCVVGE